MTAVAELVTVLREEQTALRERNWGRVQELALQKEAMVEQLDPPADMAEAQLAERLAAENARLISIIKEAASSVVSRLQGLSERARSVGYNEGGDKLNLDQDEQSKRV